MNGLAFAGCAATVTGTIPINASVNATANVPFTFTNDANQGPAVSTAIAG